MKIPYSKLAAGLTVGAMLLGMGAPLATFAATAPTTNPATSITASDATLNGTNGDTDSTMSAFWVATSTYSVAADPNPAFPSNMYSTGDRGPVASSTAFSAQLSSITYPAPLAVTPNTTYYFNAWTYDGTTWNPGAVLNFTTAPTTATNTAPVANDQSVSTSVNAPVAITLTASDADHDALTYATTSSPTNGTLSGTAPNLTYTPNASYTGSDSFTFTANDGTATSNTATVSITVSAATSTCSTDDGTFDTFTLGSVNGQHGWSATGPYDQAIVNNTYGYASFGCKSLRISNAVTSSGFGDQVFSPSYANEAGETTASSSGFSGGTRTNHFDAQFDIASTMATVQPGLSLSVSPDRGDGSRMSYLRFEDQADGIHVFFDDVTDAGPVGTTATFNESDIATLSRTAPHTIKFSIDFVDGPANDVVRISIDGALVHTGTTWEDYYRYDPEQTPTGNQVPTVDSLLFRAKDPAVPSTLGNGFLFDNVNVAAATTTGPVITLNGENPQIVFAGSTYTDEGATVTDPYDGTKTITSSSTVNTEVPGDYPVVYNDTDSHGQSASVTRTVTVESQAVGGGGGGGGGSSSSSGSSSSGGSTTTTTSNPGSTTTTTTTGQVLGASTFNFTYDLTIGATGDAVIALQQLLIADGYSIPAGATGYFGVQTQAAVKAYQAANGIPATGYVGPLTRASLNVGTITTVSGEARAIAIQNIKNALPSILAALLNIQAELHALVASGAID